MQKIRKCAMGGGYLSKALAAFLCVLLMTQTILGVPFGGAPKAYAAGSATISDVVVDGTVGIGINTYNFTITLSGNTFNNENLGWDDMIRIDNLPSGITVSKGQGGWTKTSCTFALGGVSSASVIEPIEVTVLGTADNLTDPSGGNITVTQNLNARWNILPANLASAAITPHQEVTGILGGSVTSPDYFLDVQSDTFNQTINAATMASMFTNMPDGLSIVMLSEGGNGQRQVKFKFQGTPTSPYKIVEDFKLTIPGSVLTSGRDLGVTITKGFDRWNINSDAPPAPSATIGNGEVVGKVGEAINPVYFRIELKGDTFKTALTSENLRDAIQNLPAGLTVAKDMGGAAGASWVNFGVSGTPTAASTEALSLKFDKSLLNSGIDITVTENANAKWNIASGPAPTTPAATISDGTVAGTVGSAIAEKEFTLTLANETFDSILSNDDLADMFDNLPTGLTLTKTDGGTAGSTSVKFKISGTPTEAISGAFDLFIGAQFLASNENLPVTANTKAKWAIDPKPAPAATISDGTVAGTVGSAIAEKEFPLTLANDKFAMPVVDAAIKSMFTNLPTGLTVVKSGGGSANDTFVKFKISGTPTAVATGAFSMKITKDMVSSNTAYSVTSNTNAKWAITKPVLAATISDGTVAGTAGSAIAEKEFTLTLVNDKFETALTDTTIKNMFVDGFPGGLSVTKVDGGGMGDTFVKFKISGTPTAVKSGVFSLEINRTLLESDTTYNVTANANAKWDIKAPTATLDNVVIAGQIGKEIVAEEAEVVYINLNGATVKTEFMGEDISSWCQNLPEGLKLFASGLGDGETIVMQFVGTPKAASSQAIKLVIPKGVLSYDETLVVDGNAEAVFNIVAAPGPTPGPTPDPKPDPKPLPTEPAKKLASTGDPLTAAPFVLLLAAAAGATALFVSRRKDSEQ